MSKKKKSKKRTISEEITFYMNFKPIYATVYIKDQKIIVTAVGEKA